MHSRQGGGADGFSRSVPRTQGPIDEWQTKWITGTPCRRRDQAESSEKAALRLRPDRRVDALKKTTGRDPPVGEGPDGGACWDTSRAIDRMRRLLRRWTQV